MSIFICKHCGELISAPITDCLYSYNRYSKTAEIVCPECREQYIKCDDCGCLEQSEDSYITYDYKDICQSC